MGFNSVENAVFLFIVLMTLGVYLIVSAFTENIYTLFVSHIISAGFTPPAWSTDFYPNTMAKVQTGLRTLIWIMIGMAFFTSFVDGGNLMGYVGGAIMNIFISVILLVMASIVWNSLIVVITQDFTITGFANTLGFYPQFFVEIITANMIAGLLSFFWQRRTNDAVYASVHPQ